jgi:site-specific DNA-cytosine methylase
MQAGYQHIDGYEIMPKIAEVARLNGFDVRVADVCAVPYEHLAPASHLHASPSCKNASQAKTDGGETEEDKACAAAVYRAIQAHQGDSFSLENVWGYRNFESFTMILEALRLTGFQYDYDHINAADYGVPQTRKRLILRAVRGRTLRPMHPTHRGGGDMFSPPWVGWYEAIEDLIPFLPETRPAPWQIARIPKELRESVLVESKNANQEWGLGYRPITVPAYTVVTDHKDSHQPRAFIIGGGNTNKTIIDSLSRNHMPLCGDRAGRWVKMTVQALGRFQTVPDAYKGLTAEINGNGVPSRLARCIMESFA